MARKIRTVIFIVVLLLFVGVVGYIGITYYSYGKERAINNDAVAEYVKLVTKAPTVAPAKPAGPGMDEPEVVLEEGEYAPIEVDFEALQAVNPDVMGWIYCEDTVINYPILKGTDNDYYLHHNYLGQSVASASIFMDYRDLDNFGDVNSIIYGHHMRDKSMFASLSNWADQEYYEAHPIMWILTPEQNYKLVLFSEYTTSATSDSYHAIRKKGKDLDDYIKKAASKSNFTCDVELDPDAKYVMLSTCAYVFDNARYVIHGKLVPVAY